VVHFPHIVVVDVAALVAAVAVAVAVVVGGGGVDVVDVVEVVDAADGVAVEPRVPFHTAMLGMLTNSLPFPSPRMNYRSWAAFHASSCFPNSPNPLQHWSALLVLPVDRLAHSALAQKQLLPKPSILEHSGRAKTAFSFLQADIARPLPLRQPLASRLRLWLAALAFFFGLIRRLVTEGTTRHRSWNEKKIGEVAWEPVSARGSEELSPVSKVASSGRQNKDLEDTGTVQDLRMAVKVVANLARSFRKTQTIVL